MKRNARQPPAPTQMGNRRFCRSLPLRQSRQQMLQRSTAESALGVPDVTLCISKLIDNRTIFQLSKVNRSTYRTLLGERSRKIFCQVVDTPSLWLFLKSRFLRSVKPVVRSLTVIPIFTPKMILPKEVLQISGKECFHRDPREPDAHRALVDILRLIGEIGTLEEFSYHSWDDDNTFLCIPKEVFQALEKSSRSLRTTTLTAHPCNWVCSYL